MHARALSFGQLVLILSLLFAGLFSVSLLSAWNGPSGAPPTGNIPAPLTVLSTAQVKDGGISLDALGVFGNAILSGSDVSYINFGSAAGEAGYGLRNNNGVMQFKHEGGQWLDFCTSCNN